MSRQSYADIQYPDAYDAAIRRRIQANASKTRRATWDADPANVELSQWMFAQSSPFIGKMVSSLLEWGSLTDNQKRVMVEARDQDGARKAARAAANAEKAKTAVHVGTEGKREVFGPLTVTGITGFEGTFGYVNIYIMSDVAGNVLVYKGSSDWQDVARGAVVTVKATVKAHDVRDGVAQTILSRPVRQ